MEHIDSILKEIQESIERIEDAQLLISETEYSKGMIKSLKWCYLMIQRKGEEKQ